MKLLNHKRLLKTREPGHGGGLSHNDARVSLRTRMINHRAMEMAKLQLEVEQLRKMAVS